jgi:hypothetical protein
MDPLVLGVAVSSLTAGARLTHGYGPSKLCSGTPTDHAAMDRHTIRSGSAMNICGPVPPEAPPTSMPKNAIARRAIRPWPGRSQQ